MSTLAPARSFAPALLLASVPSDPAGGTESWIQILKQGQFWDPRYGDFAVDDAMFDAILSNFQESNRAVPGDYDHAFNAMGNSRACGWVKELERRADEMWAKVQWTEEAAKQIRAGEYRYISPEYNENYVDETGKQRGPALLAFGLTNRPFLEGMAEVTLSASPSGSLLHRVTGNTNQEAPTVDPKKLAEALGLPEDATEETILARVSALTPDPDAVVLTKDEHTRLLTEAGQSRADAEAARVLARDAVIEKAISDGKILPAMRSVFLTAYDADPAETTKNLAAMKPLDLFKAHGQAGEDQNGEEIPEDATFSDRVETRARQLMKDDKGLTYRDAVGQAYKELDQKKAVA